MMPTPLLLLAGIAAVLVAGFALWAVRRRAAAAPVSGSIRTAVERAGNRPDIGAEESADERSGVPDRDYPEDREVLHQLYAIAFDATTFSRGAVVAGSAHAAVVARSVSLLQKIETQPRYTPRRPQVLPQLMRTVNDPKSSGRMMADIIGKDPVLAGNLLRIASSPLYCVQSRPVEDFTHAVAMVGTDGIRHLIAAAVMQPVMGTSDVGAFAAFADLIWEYTLLSAAAATDHAKLVERDDAFAAQLLGLLQGLGLIIVGRVVRDQYNRQPGLVPDADVVTALLDAWAAPAAFRVSGTWELPPRVCQALDHSRHGVTSDSLGRSLRFGRLVGALALLCKHGRMDETHALAMLASVEPRQHATADIWKRVRRSVDSAG
ncbi:HDOD domain-containing protein [Lysobacter sp. A286]